MENRPLCTIENCSNIAKFKHTNKNGTRYYLKVCSTHYKLLYKKKVYKNCLECKLEFLIWDKRSSFCSKKCSIKYRNKYQKYNRSTLKKTIGKCEYCSNDNIHALAMHHLISKKLREGKNRNERVVLCHNCHHTLHAIIGCNDFPIHSKEETLNILSVFFCHKKSAVHI